jgi:hypothetical protein
MNDNNLKRRKNMITTFSGVYFCKKKKTFLLPILNTFSEAYDLVTSVNRRNLHDECELSEVIFLFLQYALF